MKSYSLDIKLMVYPIDQTIFVNPSIQDKWAHDNCTRSSNSEPHEPSVITMQCIVAS